MILAQIEPVIGGVLRNEVQFLHPVLQQRLGLRYHVRLSPAAVTAAHLGDNAEAARVIASLGDL